jgi:hypothetical protein
MFSCSEQYLLVLRYTNVVVLKQWNDNTNDVSGYLVCTAQMNNLKFFIDYWENVKTSCVIWLEGTTKNSLITEVYINDYWFSIYFSMILSLCLGTTVVTIDKIKTMKIDCYFGLMKAVWESIVILLINVT